MNSLAKTKRKIQDDPAFEKNAKKISEVDIVETNCYNVLLYLALMQIFLGLLMCTFGVLVIMNEASLAQIGGGLWGGCLAVSAGTAGILAAAKSWCPLRTGAQKVAQTVSLTLNMITLAIAQLVLVLAATGLARDVHKSEIIESNTQVTEDIVEVLPSNYPALLSNVGLLIIAAFETVCAAVASYKTARLVCPCFRQSSGDENLHENLRIGGRDALVSSWLGKHSMQTVQPQIYVVHAPSTLGRHSKHSGGMPILLQQPMMGPTMYPLIPAPLGPVPSPIIPTLPRDHHYRRLLRDRQPAPKAPSARSRSRSRSKSKEKQLTEADVAKTYTGLDRMIAEEFIQICDSRNNSLCSDSSCRDSCQCASSDMGSRDYLIDKVEKV